MDTPVAVSAVAGTMATDERVCSTSEMIVPILLLVKCVEEWRNG